MSRDFEKSSDRLSFVAGLAVKAGAAATALTLVACGSSSAAKSSSQPECKRGAVAGFYNFGQGEGIDDVLATERITNSPEAIIDGTVCFDLASSDVQNQINKIEKHSQGGGNAYPHPHDQVTRYNYSITGLPSVTPAQ